MTPDIAPDHSVEWPADGLEAVPRCPVCGVLTAISEEADAPTIQSIAED
jgi:hypothetical protein